MAVIISIEPDDYPKTARSTRGASAIPAAAPIIVIARRRFRQGALEFFSIRLLFK